MSEEDRLIAEIFAPFAGAAGLGLRDDAAALRPPPGRDLVLTTDALVAGVHFFADDPPEAIARKALRVNLSDLAAKAAEPLGFLLSLALPADFGRAPLKALARGLAEDARDFGCPLVGGDTVATPGPLTLSIAAFGAAPAKGMVTRSGARPGDHLFVTGSIGDAAIGLALRSRGEGGAAHRHLLDRYLLPQPRLGLRGALTACASAAMDLSDGLIGDLAKLVRTSGVGSRVRLFDVPLSEPAREAVARDASLFETALTGGDDYEILAAVPPDRTPDFIRLAKAAGQDVTRIGEALGQDGPTLFLDREGREVAFRRSSFSHF